MPRPPVQSFSDPEAARLIKQRLHETRQSQSTVAALMNYILELRNASSLFAFQVRRADKNRGPGLTIRYNGNRIGYIDIEHRITCKLITNGKPLASFHNAVSCNALGNKGSEGFLVRLSDSTWMQLYTDTLYMLDLMSGRQSSKTLRYKPDPDTPSTIAGSMVSSTTKPEARSLQVYHAPAMDQYEANPKDDDYSAPEGEEKYRIHRVKERDRRLVIEKKRAACKKDPLLHCEICGFSFAEKYGSWGAHFAEVHHKTPLSSIAANAKTRLKDLAIVCSNCHSMIHRQGHHALTIDELRQVLCSETKP